MPDKKISELVNLTSLAADDEFVVVDADANATKRTTYDTLATEIRTEAEALTGTTGTFSGDITSNGETVYHRGNILGTVSQSGGDPTGAIIERDSNANGEYVKYADGTMICTLEDTVTNQPINTAYGGLYQGTRSWTYPVPFTATPVAFCGEGKHSSQANWQGLSSANTTSAVFRFWDVAPRSTGANFTFSFGAIGRWY